VFIHDDEILYSIKCVYLQASIFTTKIFRFSVYLVSD